MIGDVQHEVAVHLLANALRKQRLRSGRRGAAAAPGALGSPRDAPEDAYLRGMLDLLRALYGRALADAIYREARALEGVDTTG